MRFSKFAAALVRRWLERLFHLDEKPLFCSAVIVAAGSSTRMGEDKIMMELEGMPVLARTLLAFEHCALINEIIVVTRQEKISDIAELCKKYGVSKASKVICGGAARVESCLAGVSAADKKAELIAIHDGARPFVSDDLICRTVKAAGKYLAAAPVLHSTDTLKAMDEKGMITATIDRKMTTRVQTPQIFDADLIKGALSKAVKDHLELTDDCSAMEIMGVKTFGVEGDENNIKLTTPRDLMIASAILKNSEM